MPPSPQPEDRSAGLAAGVDSPSGEAHQAWLAAERRRLWDFGRGSVVPGRGFGWLDDHGVLDTSRPVEAWITCRMTHVAALEVLAGNTEAAQTLDHGVRALETALRDRDHDGWYAAVGARGPLTTDKRAYEHAFVVLAAASARAAGHPAGESLLAHALQVFEERFWSAEDGMAVDVWDREWTTLEEYRGANANMHSVEALLAAWDVTGSSVWLDHARSITERLVHVVARSHEWLMPEHFTPGWSPLLDYNRAEPAHPFRPFGATVGHLLEWSRLSLHLRRALGETAPTWLLDDARSLFDAAVRVGWDADGAEGFVYTTDFTGRPVVRTRLHWVVAEGIAAAYALWSTTGEQQYQRWYAAWWDHAERFFVDRTDGSWRHELDPRNRPASTVWKGKPDIYHAYQAALLPALGEITSFAGALRDQPRTGS